MHEPVADWSLTTMAERTLRERCIERMTEEMGACIAKDLLFQDWPVRMFDAVLGVLTEHADEWFDAWASREDPAFTGLLAVLGGDQ